MSSHNSRLRIREQAEASRKRERSTAALYALSRQLARERKKGRIYDIAVKHISEVFQSQIVILVLNKQGELAVLTTGAGTFAVDQKELSVARWVFDNRHSAGLGTDTLPGAKALYLPMVASTGVVGVIGVFPGATEKEFDPEDIHFLESFVNQTAMAMERVMMAKEAHEEHLKAEAQNVRNTFLSSVSHDLRSPLAVVTGAASTLLEKEASLDRSARLELLNTIHEETRPPGTHHPQRPESDPSRIRCDHRPQGMATPGGNYRGHPEPLLRSHQGAAPWN